MKFAGKEITMGRQDGLFLVLVGGEQVARFYTRESAQAHMARLGGAR